MVWEIEGRGDVNFVYCLGEFCFDLWDGVGECVCGENVVWFFWCVGSLL